MNSQLPSRQQQNTFWNQKWEKQEIGFHLAVVHPLLKRYLPECEMSDHSTVFVPLCGKSLDIGYLLDLGHRVIANELNERAVQQLFEEMQIQPEVEAWMENGVQHGKIYHAKTRTPRSGGIGMSVPGISTSSDLIVFVGDFFELSKATLTKIDLVYDRAALVAFPAHVRPDYAQHLCEITGFAKQLLITLDYDQVIMAGPPYAVSHREMNELYGRFQQTCLRDKDIIEHEPRFAARGLSSFYERVYILNR